MSDTLFRLRLEHGNLSKLLRLIDEQVAATDLGAPMDRNFMSLACEYFSDQPDLCHHPKDDLCEAAAPHEVHPGSGACRKPSPEPSWQRYKVR